MFKKNQEFRKPQPKKTKHSASFFQPIRYAKKNVVTFFVRNLRVCDPLNTIKLKYLQKNFRTIYLSSQTRHLQVCLEISWRRPCLTGERLVSNYNNQCGRKPFNTTRLLIIHYNSQWPKTRRISFLFSDLSQ